MQRSSVGTQIQGATRLYRIVDFFSAANLLTQSHLYVPLAGSLMDPNEGIDSAIAHHAMSAGPCAGITGYFRSLAEFQALQSEKRSLTYISCWSEIKDSVALWGLYSRDQSSIQISTTVDRLRVALEAVVDVNSRPNAANPRAGDLRYFFQSANIFRIQYLSLRDLNTRIDRRRRAYDRLESLGRIQPPNLLDESSSRDRARCEQYQYAAFELKDKSFSHEEEVRAVIEVLPYTDESISRARSEMREKLGETYKESRSADLYLRDLLRWGVRERMLQVPNNMYVPVPDGFVDEISIDPRCPPHKASFMAEFFSSKGIAVTKSPCFGYAGDYFRVVPRQNVLNKEKPSR